MEFRILGSLEVVERGRLVTPQRKKQRALLTVLVLHANESVPSDVLLEAVWGEHLPRTAQKALQGHVSALRKLLGPDRIRTQALGYLLRVEPGELDADRFESLLGDARSLADFRYDDFAQAQSARLEELRINAMEERLEAQLALGRHAEVLSELERLVSAHPMRERLRGQQMLALFRAGRQSEALQVYREGRRRFAEELGIDPGPALQMLEQQILAQDPALAPPELAVPAPQRQERKRVTVLVAEFTSLGLADPEELEQLVRPTVEHAEATLRRFGATVQPLFSNALIGIFGAPRAHEDDVERAVSAGAALVASSTERGRLAARVGIERGDALVTIERDRIEVTGDVVASASRLQATASANEVALGEALERARGKTEDHEVPFVGRRYELDLLERTYERVVRENAAQLVTIVGEPGSGKSRLAREFRALLERREERHTWLSGRCLPYGDGVTFWALGEIVKAATGILESDDPGISARKLGAAVARLADSDDRAWIEGSLAPLVGLAGPAGAGREQSSAAWRRFLEALAERQPLVLLIEDLHWADPALVEFVDDLVERSAGVPLFLLCSARLEFLVRHPHWAGGKRNATTVTLPPLSTEETRAVARAQLDGQEPSEAMVVRAGGNPLFARELARMRATDADTLPESLHGVIAARLDTLEPAAKQTAMDAAVIGEVFWPGAVAAIAGLREPEVEEQLQRLAAGEVVRRKRTSTVKRQSEHTFLHVLVRDVAYEQIPRTQRAQKHAAAAGWIEDLAGERVIDHAELIAHHYGAALEYVGTDDAELSTKARRFLTLAGDRAMSLDVAAAERFYRRALALAPGGDRRRGELLVLIGRAAQDAGRLADAERLYDQAIDVLRAGGDARALGAALTERSAAFWRRGAGEAATRALT